MNGNTTILNIKKETNDTTTLILKKPVECNFIAGQYIMLGFGDKRKLEGKDTIPVTFSSSPLDEDIHLTIKDSGVFSDALCALQVGDEVYLRGPAGNAYNVTAETTDNLVLIAGGTGITPYRSIIRFLNAQHMTNKIIVFNGNTTEEDIIFREELDAFNTQKNITIINTLSEPSTQWTGETGFVNKSMIEKYVPDLQAYTFMICGSPNMVHELSEILSTLNIDKEKIKIDPWEIAAKGDKEAQ